MIYKFTIYNFALRPVLRAKLLKISVFHAEKGSNTTIFQEKCYFFRFFVVSLNTLHYICQEIQSNISYYY